MMLGINCFHRSKFLKDIQTLVSAIICCLELHYVVSVPIILFLIHHLLLEHVNEDRINP